MSSNVILGVRIQPNQYQRIKLNNISLEDKVETIKEEAAKKINVQKRNLEFIYCGVILDDNASLLSCGIKSGVTIHVLEKKPEQAPVKARPITENDIQQLAVAFKSFNLLSGYRTVLQRLTRPGILENIIAATPGLIDDPVAIAMICDPELIMEMSDPDTVRRIAELHPTLIEAAHQIAAFVHEEVSKPNHTRACTSSGYSYSLEALSDDEDMDSPQEMPFSISRNSSMNAITATQLAAAIANATPSTSRILNLRNSSLNNTPNVNEASGNIITSEMFTNAMQQAFASSPRTNNSSTYRDGTQTAWYETYEQTMRLQPQLQQMHEMGLLNEEINLRALRTTAGDVQAAIELVLSGAFE